jgi:hypothetical protein
MAIGLLSSKPVPRDMTEARRKHIVLFNHRKILQFDTPCELVLHPPSTWSSAALSDLNSELIVAMEKYSQYVRLLLTSRFAVHVEIDLPLLFLGDDTPLHCVLVNKME